MSHSIRNAWKNALNVSERQILEHVPTPSAIQVAEALLGGATSGIAIAEAIGVTPAHVWGVLRDPVESAWVSHQVTAHVQYRLGQVTAAIFTRACTGDVQAARLIFERYGTLVSRSEVKHNHSIDLTKLSDSDLNMVLRSKLLGQPVIDAEAVVIDARTEGEKEVVRQVETGGVPHEGSGDTGEEPEKAPS